MSEKLLKLKRAKLQQLFQRIQRTFDLAKNATTDKKKAQQFWILYDSTLKTVAEYDEVALNIEELELELKPEYTPKLNDAHMEMCEYIQLIAAQLNKSTSESQPKPVGTMNNDQSNLLPKIELPIFDGDQTRWSVFYEMFKNMIHDNKSLSNQQKVQYLVSKLSNEAANISRHLPPVANNYEIIWEALVQRYNDPRSQTDAYLKQIFEFNALKSESRVGLVSIVDQFCSSITALKRLRGEDVSDVIFLYQGLKILDPISRKAFEASVHEKDVPTYSDLVSFIHKQIKSLPYEDQSKHVVKQSSKPKVFVVQSHSTSNKTTVKISECLKCSKKNHKLIECREFLKLSPWERYRFVKDKGCCLKCFSSAHLSKICTSKNCNQCNQKHNSLLHFGTLTKPSSNSDVQIVENKSISCCSTDLGPAPSTVLLSTAVVHVRDKRGRLHNVRVLVDSASQSHFITRKLCRKLGLLISPFDLVVHGFGGNSNVIRGRTFVTVQSRTDTNIQFSIEPLVVDNIIDKLPSSRIDNSKLSHLKGLRLADDNYHIPSEIDAIIGAELVPYIIQSGRVEIESNCLMALESVFGYILMGRAPVLTQSSENSTCLMACHTSLDSLVRKFWEVENIPDLKKSLTVDEIECENNFTSSVHRVESGRFVVSLSFAKSPDCLGDSYLMAERRFLNLEKRLDRDQIIRLSYHDVILDYLQQGHMALVENQSDKNGYFIPHHAVIKKQSQTTPLRIVFDAGAKTTSGLSLNDTLHVGPKLQTDIFVLLLNFRLFSIAVTADIKQMYRQILVDESCRKFQRLLWRFSSNDPIQIYELKCVVFGLASSPFLALRTVQQLVHEEGENFPHAKSRIPGDMFMDDLVTSVPSLSEANQLCGQAKELFKKGGFELTKWASNSTELMTNFAENEKSISSKDFETGNSLAILGLKWQPGSDSFRFVVNPNNSTPTKRNILSFVARIFDPLGLLSPLTLFLKCLIKELWHLGVDWDETVPSSITRLWELCQEEFHLLSNLTISRHLGVLSDSKITLIGFCDASASGYGGVIYLKSQIGMHPPTIILLCGKSKVAPSKTLSIPRLELCAALLLAELLKTVVSVLSLRCHVTRVVALSDSTVTLHWIRACPSKWQTFVANRVSKIQDCPVDYWLHVPGDENPADCLSRGLTPADMANHKLWWTGPTWLAMEENDWPVKVELEASDCLPEAKSNTVVTVIQSENPSVNVIHQLIERCSNYHRLLRIMVSILKMVRILPRIGELDFNVAETYLCRVVQKIHFAKELHDLKVGNDCSSRLQQLSPFLDGELIRVGGRLQNAEINFDSCHPIVLPKNDPLVTLLIDYYHVKHCHAGPHLLASLLRQKFWILSARVVIRNRIRKCNKCFRCRPTTIPPKMGNLPSCRVLSSKPFATCGVDYCGPIQITMARRRNPFIFKSYICLFICMATKAVHIELVSDLSTAMFLSAFRRFLSRRGPCSVMYSDCGTNFVGAYEQLQKLSQLLNSTEFQNSLMNELAEHRIDWKFIPPGSPHFGGIWESNVKSVKSHLIRVIGTQLLTYEELNTVLVQVEAVLNSRPLCPLSEDPREPLALTPAHFLNLTPLKAFPMRDVTEIPVNRLTRYELIDQLVQSFWNRWRVEYLHELQTRKKWTKSSPPLTVGTVVIVDQPNLPPLQWPIGIVEEVFPGADGQVRVALVRLKNSRLKRPVTKLFPLPTQ